MVHICTAIVSPNNLPKFRSYEPVLDAKAEATLIQEAQNGNERSGSALHRRFHSQILRLAGEHVPPGSTIWTKKRQHTTELFDDLVAQGHLALWEAVLAFDLKSGNRLWTLAVKRIAGAISDAAKQWRKGGIAGETRVDRWLLHNANPNPSNVKIQLRSSKFRARVTAINLPA
jgi:hypothetical protein